VTPLAPGIFNDILGPVMRGPSSSHTAGSFHIAVLARALVGGQPSRARFTFDPGGSYAQVYRQQGVDLAFAAGLLGWSLTDDRFPGALAFASAAGLDIGFTVAPLAGAAHPNTVDVELTARDGARTGLRAASVGGGAIEITRLDGWALGLTGQTYTVLAEVAEADAAAARAAIEADGATVGEPHWFPGAATGLLAVDRVSPLAPDVRRALVGSRGVHSLREAPPIAFPKRGAPLFTSGRAMIDVAEARGWTLGRAALAYEAALLGLPEGALVEEMGRRFEIMRSAVRQGLSASAAPMQLLAPTAGAIFDAEAGGRLAIGGLHTRAAARAMAVMHVNGAMGVVCAAPTGGSAGVLPGVVVTLAEERGLSGEALAHALFAAAAIGLVVAFRATFAAEVAGCQVEIGAAGAMAAAAVVESAGGTARQAADAAAIAFQNTMGSVCDLVQGAVEIPCHTRNAVGASSAFVCADLVLGGYHNPISLDETVDAVYDVGRMMPAELRCTSRGGLAITPSALKLHRR
jgi:L-serine dehydratase